MPQVLTAGSVIDSGRRIKTSFGAPLRPLIFGSKAGLHRYSVAGEKTEISLGDYDVNQNTVYSYPDKASGSIVDLDYVKLYMDDAYLQYFAKYIGVGSGTVAPVANYNNRVRASDLVFKEYTNASGTTFSRSSDFYDRDVAVGDIVRVRGTVGSQSTTFTTSVNGFINESIPSVIGAASADSDNAASQSSSTSISQVADTPVNEVVATADGSAYDGLADGDISETYTITVIQSSTNSDATTARLQVTSASGNDDQASVTPAAFGDPTDIGTRGLTVTFALSGPGTSESIDQNDLVVGQSWTVTVEQSFTPPTATSGGTAATGLPTTTYIITVTRGGSFVDPTPPQITVSTTTGVDVSGPTNATVSTALAVGTYGVTVTFTGSALRKGDIYHISTTRTQLGAYKTIILKDSLPSGLVGATDLDIWLFIEKNGLLITENRLPSPPDKNWVAAASTFTVNSDIEVYEDSWTDDGTPLSLPVVEGTMYLEYREWLTSGGNTIYNIYDVSEVEATFGTVDPDNPIAYAVDKALRNTGYNNLTGVSVDDIDIVRAVWLADDPSETQSWQDVLDLVEGVESIYNLIPLTTDTDVLDIVASHVSTESAAEVASFRAAIFQLTAPSVQTIRSTNDDSSVILATLVQNPEVTSTSYSQFVVEGQTPKFITSGVVAGDVVRYLYTTDGFGSETYTEFTIASVVSEDTLLVETGHTSAVNVAQKIVIVRYPSKAEIITDLITQAESYGSDRVLAIWPDTINDAGQEVAGYYLAAALGGLMGSVAPHQPLTNVEVLGFDAVSRSKDFFTNKQLQQLADGGVFVVTEAPDGTVYIRKAWTTDPSSIGSREEMARRNSDAARFAILSKWHDYIGNANNVPSTYAAMNGDFTGVIGEMRSDTFLPRLGSMVLAGSLDELRSHAVLADRAVANITLQVPYPLNVIELNVVI